MNLSNRYLKAWLSFNTSTTEDAKNNNWQTYGNPTIGTANAFNGNALQLDGQSYLKLSGVELGGRDFYIDGWVYVDSSSPNYARIISIVNPSNGHHLVSVRKSPNDATKIDFWRNSTADVSKDNGYTATATVKSVGTRVHFKLIYRYTDKVFHLCINDNTYVGTTSAVQYNRQTFDIYIGANANGSQGLIGTIDELRIYDGTWFSYSYNNPPTLADYQNITFSSDFERKIEKAPLNWRYENYGTADLLTVSGTTLTDLPVTQSKTGSAFYQTARAKCFDIPATKEIWLKFDVYTTLENRWRAYNKNSNGSNGICSQTAGNLSLFATSAIYNDSNLVKNQLQTYLLHMISDSSGGVIEAWLDGVKIYTYTGNVNNGEDFADIFLQSDGEGTFFSNVIISNVEIGLNEDIPLLGFPVTWSFDIQRVVNNTIVGAKETVVYLHFDDPNNLFLDACGNKWNALDYEDLPADEYTLEYALTTGKFGNGVNFSNSFYLKIDEPIKLGGKDFTIDFWLKFSYNEDSSGVFEIVSTETSETLVSLCLHGSDATLTLEVSTGSGNSSTYDFSASYYDWHHYAYVYYHDKNQAVFYLDGVAVQTINFDSSIAEQDCTANIGKAYDAYYLCYGDIDEFRIANGISLWSADFSPPSQQIMFFNVNADFDTQRILFKTLSLDFDIQRKISEAGSWYYENFGNASLLAPEATNVEGVTVTDLSSDVSKTGSAFWVPEGLLRNMFGLPATKEIWAKFDGYLTDDGAIFAYDIEQLASRYGYYGFGVAEPIKGKLIATLLNGSSTATDSVANQTLTGLHAFLIHLLSDTENGKIELWIDDETTPALTFTGNVYDGDDFTNFYVTSARDTALVSNLIVSNKQLSITDDVQFIGYSYIKNLDVERVLTNDTWLERVLDATKVLLTFDNDQSPFDDLGDNHWTAYGNPTVSADNAKFGKALRFNDKDQYLKMDEEIELGAQDFTVDGWFAVLGPSFNGTYRHIFGLDGEHFFTGMGWENHTINLRFFNSALEFSVHLPDKTDSISKTTAAGHSVSTVTDNTFHHFAISYSNSLKKIFFSFDGITTATDLNADGDNARFKVRIGKILANGANSKYSSPLNGAVDEFRIINGMALYTHDFTPPTRSAWGKKINTDFDIIRQIPHELIITPAEDFIYVAKNETDGTQSIEINISAQQLTDQLSFTTINNADIMQQVKGQYLDYYFDMRIESFTQRGILNTCHCCADIDKILYQQLNYSVDADFVTYEVNLKSKTMHINTAPVATTPTPETEYETTEIKKASALNHLQHIAAALDKNLVCNFDNFISDLELEQKNITLADLLRELFGWTSRLPHLLINCYIRDDTLYVIQRGYEQNTIDLTNSKHTLPVINKKIVRTTWGSSPDSSYTLNKHYLGWRMAIPPPRVSEDGKTHYTYRRIEPSGYLLTKAETESEEMVFGQSETVITEVVYEYTVQPPYELTKETTKKYVQHNSLILDQSEIIHEQLTPSQRITRQFDEDGNETGSVVGSHVAGFYDNFQTISEEHTDSQEVVIPGNPLIDTSFPVVGNDTLAKLSSEIIWLNRKTQETISFDIYDYLHVIDFNDRIIFAGNEYFLEDNTVTKNPKIVNKQSVQLVRWY